MRRVFLAGLVAGLAAPLSAMSEPPQQRPGSEGHQLMPQNAADTCNAAQYQYLIGEPRAVVEALDIPQPVRIIPEGARVTMDYRSDRINFDLDAEGRVIRVRCG